MPKIYTIGHSTRSIVEFIELLKQYSITKLVDIRTIPKSRHNPQFGQDVLKRSLRDADIAYVYLNELGGLRPAGGQVVHNAWRNKSFRNYANYMQTAEFQNGISKLLVESEGCQTAIMCAEAVPWRCHRSLVGDALVVRSVEVTDIMSLTSAKPHTLTSFAKVDGRTVTYPVE